MFKRVGLLFVMFLLLVFSVFANTDYNESGNRDNQYVTGDGIFNENFDENNLQITTVIMSDTSPKAPLISDLDGDGVKEIIILDLNVIEVRQNTTLGLSAGFTLSTASSERFSNILTFDIDGDSKSEIILIAETEEELYILDYDNGALTSHAGGSDGIGMGANEDVGATGITHDNGATGGEFVIKCFGVDQCAMAYSDKQITGFAGSPQSSTMFITHFSSTNVSVISQQSIGDSSTFATYCQPKIRHMVADQLDVDSDIELVFSVLEVNSGSTDELVKVWVIDFISANNSFLEKFEITATEPENFLDNGGISAHYSCNNLGSPSNSLCVSDNTICLASDYVTSPLVFNADPSNTGNEIIIGMATDEDEFIMAMYDSVSGAEIREFPLIQESEGLLMSNPFKANIFDDSGVADFCVMGYNTDLINTVFASGENTLVLTCGSLTDANGMLLANLQTVEFRVDVTSLGNLTTKNNGYDYHNTLAHSGEHDGTNAITEVITAYGVLKPSIGSLNQFGDGGMTLIFTMPEQDGAVVPVDYEQSETLSQNHDFIITKNQNLFYINDGQVDQPLSALTFDTNPCLDAVIQVNSTFQVLLEGTDPEGGGVTLTATLYEGDSNEQSSTVNTTSGVTAPFNFIANKTGSGVLLMTGSDQENPTETLEIERPFTVADVGVEFGDCSSSGSVGVAPAVAVGDIVAVDPEVNNSIIRALDNIDEKTGLGTAVIWFIFMGMIAIMVGVEFQKGFSGSSSSLFGILLIFILTIVELLMLFIGIKIGAIGVGTIIVLSLFGILLVGITIRRMATADSM